MSLEMKFKWIRDHINDVEDEVKRLESLTQDAQGSKDLPPFATVELLKRRLPQDTELGIQAFINELNASFQKDVEEVLPLRDAAVEHNKAIKAKATNLLNFLKVPKYEHQPFNSRKAKTPISWDTALERALPTNNGFASLHSTLKDRVRALESRLVDIRKKKEEEELKRKREQREIDRRVQLSMLRKELGLPAEATEDDIENALLDKHPYARLALAAEKTRGDWSDGPWRVKSALRQFSTQTERDAEVSRCLRECLEDFEDGRVFRDCEWNYTRLWEIVHAEHPGLKDKLQLARAEDE